MNYPWRISVAIGKVTLETVVRVVLAAAAARPQQKLPVLAPISNLFHHLRSGEQGRAGKGGGH